MEIKFAACEHLDYSDEYARACSKQLVITKSLSHYDEEKVFWYRHGAKEQGNPEYVQFCKKRGRLNNKTDCLCSEDARCSLYNEVEHSVEIK